MTLVLNEIHMLNGLNRTILIAAADRRISAAGEYYGTQRKVFRIPYFNGAVAYFGISVFRDSTGTLRSVSEWLPVFIRRQAGAESLRTFCEALHAGLEQFIPASVLASEASGFQICGYNQDFVPEYWLLTNIRQMDGFRWTEIRSTYKRPAPHFLQVDARRDFGWDGVNPASCRNGGKIYRFGDFRAHDVASEPVDDIFRRLSRFPDEFHLPYTLAQYRDYVKFKFEIIAYLYKKWSRHAIIGRPIDVFAWRADTQHRTIETC